MNVKISFIYLITISFIKVTKEDAKTRKYSSDNEDLCCSI
jgi:hypothetical protein